MIDPLKDIEGRELNVGDRIAYPGRRGSRLWITKATIVKIYQKENWVGRKFLAVDVDREPDSSRVQRTRVTLTNIYMFIKLPPKP